MWRGRAARATGRPPGTAGQLHYHRNEAGRPLIALIKCSCAAEPLEKGFTLPPTLIHSLLLYVQFTLSWRGNVTSNYLYFIDKMTRELVLVTTSITT